MVKLINKPVLFCIIELLKKYGFTDIGVTLNYKAEAIKGYFGSGAKLGVSLCYYTETEPLGTAGSVKAAGEDVADNFLVISGDAFTELDLSAFYAAHVSGGAVATIAVKEVEDATGFGVVKVEHGVVTDFVEKPQNPTEKLVNTGIYMFKREILRRIPNGFYDFGRDLFPRMIGEIRAYETDAYWSDIGTLRSYYKTNLYISERLSNFPYFE
jgi:Nucleoside-diphosphate-sugar pyrophosphorylase involved in lipopolysaccharide biosynthesis/translation initiation factor 2B, gamma/epsilon subunits (eIF-2Bgamma/eIF-2Bepsilon)